MSNCMGKRAKKMASGGKTTKAMKELEDYNTLKRETKGFQQEKPGTPYSELPMKEKLKRLMKKDKKASGGKIKKMATGGTPSDEYLKSFGKGLGKSTKDMKPPKNPKRMSPERKKRIDDLIDKNVTGKSATRRIAKGGAVKKMATGGKVKGRRGDGICSKGRTKGRMV